MSEMTRNRAQELLQGTAEYIPGPCVKCGALTFEEASTRCRPAQLPSGEYVCGSPDEGPNAENETGPLYQVNPVHSLLEGYLWGWHAVDEGYTQTPPRWTSADDATLKAHEAQQKGTGHDQ